jgi:hypothetical protein
MKVFKCERFHVILSGPKLRPYFFGPLLQADLRVCDRQADVSTMAFGSPVFNVVFNNVF